MIPAAKRLEMFRNYFLINIILIIMISVLGFKFYEVATHKVELPSVTAEKKLPKSDSMKPAKGAVNEEAYNMISELDLFRPTRSPAVKTEVKTERNLNSNPPKLFGTIILNELKTAILEDPETKTTKNYRINDSVAGYLVSDILEDKVILTRDGDSIEVKLRESKGITSPPNRISRVPSRAIPAPAVDRASRTRPQRIRRPVVPRQSVSNPDDTSQEDNLPDEAENLMENLQEVDE